MDGINGIKTLNKVNGGRKKNYIATQKLSCFGTENCSNLSSVVW